MRTHIYIQLFHSSQKQDIACGLSLPDHIWIKDKNKSQLQVWVQYGQ